ncbi:hypothetical protein CPB84DRAFT_1754067 [Gymnopilus junonius]|uniref:Uncharacterized protein n=1 Tax=Gymnopilus junonius TaxID=109634 RepID=A0A9P5TFJ3_GYMJU|nr:hypothetical protein CPB84DRAFT_1754067 [Gymnopilus junonius]
MGRLYPCQSLGFAALFFLLLELIGCLKCTGGLENDSSDLSGMVKSREGWQKEMAKWVQKQGEHTDNGTDSDDDDDVLSMVMYGHGRSKWLLWSLDLLFGGWKELSIDEQTRWSRRQNAYMEEARLMELLADEEADENPVPDDGELEGLGNDFEG